MTAAIAPAPPSPPVDPRLARDRRILYIAAFLRAVATGMMGIMIGIYLARIGLDPGKIGLIVSAGLGGAALATGTSALLADRSGRRRTLITLALRSAGGALMVAAFGNATLLAIGRTRKA